MKPAAIGWQTSFGKRVAFFRARDLVRLKGGRYRHRQTGLRLEAQIFWPGEGGWFFQSEVTR